MSEWIRSGALLISVNIDVTGGQAWYVRINSNRNQVTTPLPVQTTVDGLCEVVRSWLEDVIDAEPTKIAR